MPDERPARDDLSAHQERWRADAEPALRAWLAAEPAATELGPVERETALGMLVTLEVLERTARHLRNLDDPGWLKVSETAMRLWNHLGRLGYPRVSRLAAELEGLTTPRRSR